MDDNSTQNILVVDDDPTAIQLLARILAGVGHVRFATNGADALRLAQEWAPDLLLLDAEMPGMTGFKVCEHMKADELLATVPVIFVTSHSEPEFEATGFEIGAADFIAKPVDARLVLARVKAQLRTKAMSDQLRYISTIDALTGVGNRRTFDAALPREWRRGRRSGDPISLLLVDVDHFKRFNDRYGHPSGDVCLRAVAQALIDVCMRPADCVARYGGEEFVMLLPQTPRAGAEHMARRVLEAIDALAIDHAASPTARRVTVSIGVGCYDSDAPSWIEPSAHSGFGDDTRPRPSPEALLAAADQALYVAKEAGRAQGRLLYLGDADAPATASAIPADRRMPRAGRHE